MYRGKKAENRIFVPLLVHYPEDLQGFQSHTHNSYNQILDQDHHIPPAQNDF